MLWSVESLAKVSTLKGHTNDVISIKFLSDGKHLISGGSDNTIRLWDMHKFVEVLSIPGKSKYMGCVAFSEDGKHFV
jgi:WD40 repeat protein